MQAKKEDLPHIYLWNPESDNTMPYPEKMNIEDVHKYSPDTMLTWIQVGKLQTDIASVDDEIKEINEEIEAKKKEKTNTDEADDDHLVSLKKHLEDIKDYRAKLNLKLGAAERTLAKFQHDL